MLVTGDLLDGRYQIVRLVGKGGWAEVYEARHSILGSRHAIKILLANLAVDDELRARFLTEGQIQARLRHANIIPVTDVVTSPVPGLVMDYVEGGDLGDWVEARESPPSIQEVLALMLPVLDAVETAHRSGIVHRDLKPGNILIGKTARGVIQPMVTDFGIAKVLEDAVIAEGKGRTRTGMRMGTLLYMSPEAVRGASAVDARTDIFSLGAILYEIVTCRAAFDSPSEYDSMKNIVEGRYEAPERLVGGLNPVFKACIQKALAVDPAERFPSCAAFQATLATAGNASAPLPERPSRTLALTGRPELVAPPTPGPRDALVDKSVDLVLASKPAPRSPERPAPPAVRPTTPVQPRDIQDLRPGLIYKPGASPVGAVLVSLFCLLGAGQWMNGQVGKGFLLLVAHIALSVSTGLFFVVPIIGAIDAGIIGSKLKSGRGVGAWEWF